MFITTWSIYCDEWEYILLINVKYDGQWLFNIASNLSEQVVDVKVARYRAKMQDTIQGISTLNNEIRTVVLSGRGRRAPTLSIEA